MGSDPTAGPQKSLPVWGGFFVEKAALMDTIEGDGLANVTAPYKM